MQTEMYSRGHAYGVKHLLAPFSGPLEDVLEKALELNKESTQFLLDLGAIYLNQKRLAQGPGPNLTEIKKMIIFAFIKLHAASPSNFSTIQLASFMKMKTF